MTLSSTQNHLHLLSLLIITFMIIDATSQSSLSYDYYSKTCPQFDTIMQQVVSEKQIHSPTTAAGALRLFFHDCMVHGCDSSVLVSSTPFHKAERDADVNLNLPGDAFDLVTRAKSALELKCPAVVSCSDILAVAARNLVTMVGGPYFPVLLGRKDGLVSDPSSVESNIAKTTMSIPDIISLFSSKNFSVQEMVALSGAHTIGFSHCKEFSHRLFNFSNTSESDPAYHPKYAEGLRKLCANHVKNPSMSAFNDVMTPGKFDNMYYKNLKRGLGLLSTDRDLAVDKRTQPFVDLYAENETAFFQDFGRAMEKVSVYMIKTGRDGEVRRKCNEFNTAPKN